MGMTASAWVLQDTHNNKTHVSGLQRLSVTTEDVGGIMGVQCCPRRRSWRISQPAQGCSVYEPLQEWKQDAAILIPAEHKSSLFSQSVAAVLLEGGLIPVLTLSREGH